MSLTPRPAPCTRRAGLGVPAAVKGGRLRHSRVPGDGGCAACILDMKGSLHSLTLGRRVRMAGQPWETVVKRVNLGLPSLDLNPIAAACQL